MIVYDYNKQEEEEESFEIKDLGYRIKNKIILLDF